MKKKNLKKSILFTILIFLVALIGQPFAYGYFHLADALILLAAILLPTPAALLSAGAASLAADLLKGYYLLAPVTLIIKLLMVLLVKWLLSLPAGRKHPDLMAAPALALPVAGYFLGELLFGLFLGNGAKAFSQAIGTLPKNLVQAGVSVLIFIFIYSLAMGIIDAKARIKAQEESQEEKINE